MSVVIIDNFDSFTYNLVDYVKQLYPVCHVLRNDTSIEAITALNPCALLLSPGHGKPQGAGNLLAIIDYFHQRLPLLGVCLGHQAIGEYFGARVQYALRPMHGKISAITCQANTPLFQEIPTIFNVVRYHSLIIDHSSQVLQVTATTQEGEIMGIQHKSLPIYGIQFHPEAILTEYGLKIIANWLKISNLPIYQQ
jgi:anthranilate synthase component 2